MLPIYLYILCTNTLLDLLSGIERNGGHLSYRLLEGGPVALDFTKKALRTTTTGRDLSGFLAYLLDGRLIQLVVLYTRGGG